MARTVKWDDLRELAAFEAARGCAISVYLDLDPSVAPTRADAQTRLHSLLDEAAKSDGATRGTSHEQKLQVRSDFERIKGYFKGEFSREGARGLAVFCASLDGLWQVLPLVSTVRDDVRVDRRLYLVPLVPLVGRGTGALVVAVGREQGRFFALQDGRLQELTDLSEDQPRRHDQGGWSQARYQRHIDNLASEHLRAVADELDRLVRRRRDVDVVITGSEESRAELEGFLSADVRAVLAGWAHAEAHAGAPQLAELAAPILDERRGARERALLDRWREEAGRDGRASSGWPATLRAASDARIETLLFSDGRQREAWECPTCGRAETEAGACPLDETPLERVEAGLDVAIHQTLRHGGTVWPVEQAPDLEPVEGIGAILRY